MNYIFANDGTNCDAKASNKPYTHAVSYTTRDGYTYFSFHASAALAAKAAGTRAAKYGETINAVVETSLITSGLYKTVKKGNQINNWRYWLDKIIAENNGERECNHGSVEYHDRQTQRVLLELARLGVDTKTIAL